MTGQPLAAIGVRLTDAYPNTGMDFISLDTSLTQLPYQEGGAIIVSLSRGFW